MRSMFQLCGGALSFIVGLVGVLNFFNAILTGIIARKREFAVLQSIGMTGKQLKTMLVYEGLFYALGAAGISLVLTLVLGPVAFKAVGSMFWFFTYRLTLTPFLIVVPVFALLGVLVPLAVYRSVSKVHHRGTAAGGGLIPRDHFPAKQRHGSQEPCRCSSSSAVSSFQGRSRLYFWGD